MPARKGASTVADLLSSVSRSGASSQQERHAKQLWALVQAGDPDVEEGVLECTSRLLINGGKDAPVERCCRFFGALARQLPPGCQASADLLEALVEHLGGKLRCLDKVVRFRACQLLANTLHQLPSGAELSQELLDDLAKCLAERLDDKATNVRAQAARALGRLCAQGEDGKYADDAATAALVDVLAEEGVKDVRVAAVQALPLAPDTLPLLLDLLRDPLAPVRKAVLCRVSEAPMACLTVQQRALVLRHGLGDRDEGVRDTAQQVLGRWYDVACEQDPLALLRRLDVHTYSREAEAALAQLLAGGQLNALLFCRRAAEAGEGLAHAVLAHASWPMRGAGEGLLDPAEALLWRCVCTWLYDDGMHRGLAAAATSGAAAAVGAAGAADRHEALESALPASAADMVALLRAHVAGGAAHRYAAAQLLHLAAKCMDWTDMASRRKADALLPELLGADPRADTGDDAEAGQQPKGPAVVCHLQLLGNGGDGAYEEAVWQLLAAVHSTPAGSAAQAVLGILGLAQAWGLLGEGGGAAGADPAAWLQCLGWLALALRALPTKRAALASGLGTEAWDAVWHQLCLPGVSNGEERVRAKAVECVALYALADPSPPVLAPAALLLRSLAQQDAAPVQRVAACGLADLCAAFSCARVDGLLSAAAGEGGEGCEAGGAAGVAAGPGVAQLLTRRVGDLLDDGGGAAGKPKAGSRAAGAAAEQQRELLDAAGEALARLLLSQQLWAGAGGARGGLPDGQLQAGLEQLLVARFHPAAEACDRLRQVLCIFFDAFASHAPNHRHLAAVLAPAARRALAFPGKRQAAPLVARALQQMVLDRQPAAGPASEAALDLAQVALSVAEHAVHAGAQGGAAAKCKALAIALVKVAAALPDSGLAARRPVFRLLLERLEAVTGDAALVKEAAALQARLEACEGAEQPLTAEELDELMGRLQGLGCAPAAAAEGDAVTAAAGAAGGRSMGAAGASRQRAGRAAAAAPSDDNEEETSSSAESSEGEDGA